MPNIQPIKSVNVAGTVHPLDSVFTVLSGISTLAGSSSSSSYKSVRWYVSEVSGITEPYDGMKLAIKVPLAGVRTAGAVLSINGNADASYHPLAYNVNTPLTTQFLVDSIKIFTYDAAQSMDCYLASGTKVTVTGVWKAESNYDSNSNSLGYQVRTNNAIYKNGANTTCTRYQILVETANGLEAFTSTSNQTGTTKTQLLPKYIPNGAIRYYASTTSVAAGSNFVATVLWQQYQGINLKYSFNISTITNNSPCFIKMSRNDDGTLSPVYSAESAGHPLVFALPTTKDGYYYTYLGRTYTASSVVYLELELSHPTFYYDGGIRVYDGTYLSEATVSNWGFTKNVGTVTSVRVQTGTGLSSSTSSAQTSTLDTTISIASGYKLLTTNEYNTLNAKQDKISVGTNGQLLSSNGSSLVWTNDNRSLLHHDLATTIENTTTDKGWKMFNDTYNGFLLKSLRFQSQSPVWGVGDFGSGIVFGGADTKGVVSVAYGTPEIKFAGGNGSGPRWWIGLTGTSETTYNLDDKQDKISKLGSITQPVYFSADGTISTCAPYAGGTSVILNGQGTAGDEVYIYAPDTAGTSGYSLKSNGSGKPRWANEAAVQISGSLSAGVKNNASITLVITNKSKPLKKGVWRYSGTYGTFLIFAPNEITTQGSPKTAYICGYTTAISNNASFTLVEV